MAELKREELNQRWYEKEPFGAFWERGYRDRDLSTMGGPSIEIYEIVPALAPGSRVLDLGCGEGRNSLFLAQHGCRVTCIDRSADAIDKVRLAADRLGVEINALVSDIAHLDLDSDYEVVLSHGVLYYLTNMEWRDLLSQAKERTTPGGFNIYSVFIFSDRFPRPHEFRSARYTHSLAPRELEEFYSDWEVIRYDQYVKWDQHPGIPIHAHPVERIVARKRAPGAPDGADYDVEPIGGDGPDVPQELFDSVEIGATEEQVVGICGPPQRIHEQDFGGSQVGATRHIDQSYVLRDLVYGRTAFQLINGEVRGKYLHETEPVRVHFRPRH
jgi:tellurite methyltransferase